MSLNEINAETITDEENKSDESSSVTESSIYSIIKTDEKYLDYIKNIEMNKNKKDFKNFQSSLLEDAEKSIFQ